MTSMPPARSFSCQVIGDTGECMNRNKKTEREQCFSCQVIGDTGECYAYED